MAPTTREPAHFATKHLKVWPIAIGRTPPFFLRRAMRLAQKNTCRTNVGVRPSRMWVMNKESACTNSLPPLSADSLVKSFKWCGRNPSGPPADPHGKERMALTTSFSETGVSDAASGGEWETWIGVNWRMFQLQSWQGLIIDCSNGIVKTCDSDRTLVVSLLQFRWNSLRQIDEWVTRRTQTWQLTHALGCCCSRISLSS